MGETISATEAARNFSELLNRIHFRGERFTIFRGGKPVATLGPVMTPVGRRVRELPDLLKSLPALGEDAKAFAGDVSRSARKKTPALPKSSSWA
jgi:antitoxin (DNA-binding transcriptional repressor) of toxin-antitoxin stability system